MPSPETRCNNQALQTRDLVLRQFTDIKPDVIITVENKNYHLNKDFLSSFSPYFNAMFNRPFLESRLHAVKLREIPSQPFEALLDFISGKYPEECTNDDAELLDAIELADKICLDLFLNYYDEELEFNFSSFPLSLAFKLCQRLGKARMSEDILSRVEDTLLSRHHRSLKKRGDERIYEETNYELLRAVITRPSELRLSPDNPCTCSLSEKYLDGVLHWVVEKPSERFSCLKELLRILEVRHISENILDDTVCRVVGPDLPLWFRDKIDIVIKDVKRSGRF